MLHPDFAPPGTVVRIVAPSGPFEADAFRRGLSYFADYELRIPPDLVGRRDGFLAGPDDVRLRELQAALDCDEAHVIWLARGGYGLGRIAHRLDWSAFLRRPKWIVGFSDGTVLHQDCFARGVVSLHGPNVTSLTAETAEHAEQLRAALVGQSAGAWNVRAHTSGRAQGPLVGGNLTVLCMLAAAGRLALPPGAVLMLEDVDEASYRVDRMLSALSIAGHLDRVAGIVLGDFTNCSPGRFEVPVTEVLLRALEPLGVPLALGFPSGHGHERGTWVHGSLVDLDASAGRLTTVPRPSLTPF